MSSVTNQTGANPASSYHFEIVKKSNPSFKVVEDVLKQQKTPLYGDQSNALEKIKAREDRRTEMLYSGTNPVGFFVYKKENQSKYSKRGLDNSLEVKSFVVLDQESAKIQFYGTMLLDRLTEIAQKNLAPHLYLTISEKESKLGEFLKAKGFEVKKTWDGKYVEGLKESLVSLKTPVAPSESRSQPVEAPPKSEKKREREPEHAVQNEQISKRERDERYSGARTDRDGRAYPREDVRDQRPNTGYRSERSYPQSTFYSQEEQRHELTLRKIYIHQIQSGKKTIEGRINSGIVLRYRPGDTIRFFYGQDPKDDAICKITKIEKYSSFEAMLRTEGYKKCLADVISIDEAVRIYDAIPGYAERAKKSGVVALHLQLIPKK